MYYNFSQLKAIALQNEPNNYLFRNYDFATKAVLRDDINKNDTPRLRKTVKKWDKTAGDSKFIDGLSLRDFEIADPDRKARRYRNSSLVNSDGTLVSGDDLIRRRNMVKSIKRELQNKREAANKAKREQ